MSLFRRKTEIVDAERALPGRDQKMRVAPAHFVLDAPLAPPYPEGAELATFGMGCFWGAERVFWEAAGVISTSVGYLGGHTPNPSYEEVCGNATGHNEVVQVVFDPARTSYDELLRIFWENHDPTQGMRQGNDVGTQYRSGIYTHSDEQRTRALAAAERYGKALAEQGYGEVTTEIVRAGEYYFAEDYHQQYLAKNPQGYCGMGGTGVACPVGLATGE